MVTYVRTDHNQAPLFQVAGSSEPPRGAIKALRLAHETHGGTCFYCRSPLDSKDVTIDHVEPRVRVKRHDLHNLVIACRDCNSGKRDQGVEKFERTAGGEWLSAMLAHIQDRLNRL